MDVRRLSRDEVRAILRASEGIPSQVSLARIKNGHVSPAKVGHSITDHLHSAGFKEDKTKFLSMDDMVEALWQLLQIPTAAAIINGLAVGSRKSVRAEVSTLFGFECELPDPQGRGTKHHVKFTPAELRRAGRLKTTCVAVVEIRERAGKSHLQIHSFYPAMKSFEMESLLQAVRSWR